MCRWCDCFLLQVLSMTFLIIQNSPLPIHPSRLLIHFQKKIPETLNTCKRSLASAQKNLKFQLSDMVLMPRRFLDSALHLPSSRRCVGEIKDQGHKYLSSPECSRKEKKSCSVSNNWHRVLKIYVREFLL